jgi:hypothetical protein
MTFDLYGTTAPSKPRAPPSIDQRIAGAQWQQKGGLWVIRVPDVCEYPMYGDQHGQEFIRCEIVAEDGSWMARCWHEDRDDPAEDYDLDVADQAAAKAEALEVLRTYLQDWENTWEANNFDWEYEQAARRGVEGAAYCSPLRSYPRLHGPLTSIRLSASRSKMPSCGLVAAATGRRSIQSKSTSVWKLSSASTGQQIRQPRS